MCAEVKFLECVNELEKCLNTIKGLTNKMEEAIPREGLDGIADIEMGVEKIEHCLETSIGYEDEV